MARKTKLPPRFSLLADFAIDALKRAQQANTEGEHLDAVFAVLEAVENLGQLADEAAGALVYKLESEGQE